MNGRTDQPPTGLVKAFSASCLKAASETKRILVGVPRNMSKRCLVDAAKDLKLSYDTFGKRGDPAVLLIMGVAAQKVRFSTELCQQIAEAGYYVIRFDNRDCGNSGRHAETALGRLGSIVGMPQLAAKKIFKERTLLISLAYFLVGRLLWLKQRRKRYRFVHAVAGIAFLSFVWCRPLIPYSCEDLALDCVTLLDSLGVDQTHIVGFSMGGMVAQVFQRTTPRRCLSLVLLGSCHPNAALATADLVWTMTHIATSSDAFSIFSSAKKRRAGVERFWTNLASPAKKDDKRRRRSQTELASVEVSRRVQDADAMMRQTMAVLKFTMGGLPCTEPPPTLVIHGLQDPLIPVNCGLELAKIMKSERCMVLPDLGHDLLPAGEKEIVAAILAHLAEVNSSKNASDNGLGEAQKSWDTLKKSPSVTLLHQSFDQSSWSQDLSLGRQYS